MFVYYSKLFRRWEWVFPGGVQAIKEPPMIYVEEQWAWQHAVNTDQITFE